MTISCGPSVILEYGTLLQNKVNSNASENADKEESSFAAGESGNCSSLYGNQCESFSNSENRDCQGSSGSKASKHLPCKHKNRVQYPESTF